MYKRNLVLSKLRSTFFLWGPRQVGKTWLLREELKNATRIDLLESDTFIKYRTRPELLRQELAHHSPSRWIVIDEIQKVPALLDEVHNLIESRGFKFALCGSSARKLKRGHANLLGGRAIRRELLGLSAVEIGPAFDLNRMLNQGTLPLIYNSPSPKDLLRSYCADYLKEEVAAEGLVRNLPLFSYFLESASLSDTEQLSFATLARDVGVSAPSVRNYFEILEDTLIGNFLPAYRYRPKRRLELSPKFYFFDVGIVNFLAKRGTIEPGSELYGKAFENWVHHELRVYRNTVDPDLELSYWRTSSKLEVDFIINRMSTAIEAKGTARIRQDHFKGLIEVKKDHPSLKRRIVVCLEKTRRTTEEGIEVLPYSEFLKELWAGKLS
jgi:predicted AAA+ superfamily ATPase